jgi:hypothetical protein
MTEGSPRRSDAEDARRIGEGPLSDAPHLLRDARRLRRNACSPATARLPCAAAWPARAEVRPACTLARRSRTVTPATYATERGRAIRRGCSAPRRGRSAFRRGRTLLHCLSGTIRARPTAPPRAPYTRTPRDPTSEICSKRPKRFIDNRCCARGTVRARPSGFPPRLPPAVRWAGGGRMSKALIGAIPAYTIDTCRSSHSSWIKLRVSIGLSLNRLCSPNGPPSGLVRGRLPCRRREVARSGLPL